MDTAFCTRIAKVLEAFEAYEQSRLKVQADRLAFAARFGFEGTMVQRQGFGHGDHVTGLPGDADTEAPDGWRYSPKAGFLIPNLRKKVGKEIDLEMRRDLRDNGPDLPGMPPFHLSGHSIHSPALFRHDGAIWVGWGCEMSTFYSIEDRHGDKVDLTLWDNIRLSQYYLAHEAYEAKQVKEKV